METSGQRYLDTALTIIETHALYRDRLGWPATRAAAHQRAAPAQSPADTYAAIRCVLTLLDDKHSFFAVPEHGIAAIESGAYDREATMPDGALLPNQIALLTVPAFRGAPHHCSAYATTLQRHIAALDLKRPRGWIVDLTNNSGGNMWPIRPLSNAVFPLVGEWFFQRF